MRESFSTLCIVDRQTGTTVLRHYLLLADVLGKAVSPAWRVGKATMERVWQSLQKVKCTQPLTQQCFPGLHPIEEKAAVCNLFVQEYLLHIVCSEELETKWVLSTRVVG